MTQEKKAPCCTKGKPRAEIDITYAEQNAVKTDRFRLLLRDEYCLQDALEKICTKPIEILDLSGQHQISTKMLMALLSVTFSKKNFPKQILLPSKETIYNFHKNKISGDDKNNKGFVETMFENDPKLQETINRISSKTTEDPIDLLKEGILEGIKQYPHVWIGNKKDISEKRLEEAVKKAQLVKPKTEAGCEKDRRFECIKEGMKFLLTEEIAQQAIEEFEAVGMKIKEAFSHCSVQFSAQKKEPAHSR